MQMQTNQANTKTWLEASKNLDIRAYVECYMPKLCLSENIFPLAGMYETQREVSSPFEIGQSVIQDLIYPTEFQAWEFLSEEALRNFELRLL